MSEKPPTETRREVLKKLAFVPPLILTLPAVASLASNGSPGAEEEEQEEE